MKIDVVSIIISQPILLKLI